MTHHELWSDETEPWLLALYSDSYQDLLYNKRYEGHPNLWYSLLYVITRLTNNLSALKISQCFFAVGFVFIFLKHAPFSRFIKVLFCFGYYGLFEYGILSRLYALELFTMFSICAFYEKRFSHWYLYITLLVVNAQTHLFGLYFSGIMGLLLFSESMGLWRNVPFWQKLDNKKIGLGLLLWLLGCGYSFWSITHYLGFGHPHILDPYKIQQASTRIWQAFFPVPDFTFHFWNTSYLKTRYEILLSLMMALLFIYSLRSFRLLICLFLLFAALFYFFAFKFELYLRHHAHFFLFTISMFWVYESYIKNKPVTNNKIKLFKIVLILAIISQFVSGIYAVFMDYRYQFSPSKDVAVFIKENLPNYFLASTDEFSSSTIGAYLGKPIFNLERGDFRTFFEFDIESENTLTPYQNLHWARKLAKKRKSSIILISSKEIAIELLPYPVRLIKSFKYNYILLFDKHVFLYQIDPDYFIKPDLAVNTSGEI